MLGCPSVIRMDKGTENVLVAAVQYALRSSHDDTFAGDKSFRYGSSPANIVRNMIHIAHKKHIYRILFLMQRIESFWSHLRRHKTGWWIKALKVHFNTQLQVNHFYYGIQSLEQEGFFNRSSIIHRYTR